MLNEHGQYADYGKVGGCLITGNEDGIKHCAMNILHDLEPHDVARLLRVAGGIPAHGNQRSLWDAGCRFDLPNPEHRS
jgi:hypothetical protein